MLMIISHPPICTCLLRSTISMFSATHFSILTCLSLCLAGNAAPSGLSVESRGLLDSNANVNPDNLGSLGISLEALSGPRSGTDVAGVVNKRSLIDVAGSLEQAQEEADEYNHADTGETATIIPSGTVYLVSAVPATTSTTSTSATTTAYTSTSTQASSTITATATATTATATATACDGLVGRIICQINDLRTQAGNRLGGNANIGPGTGFDRLPVL